MIELIKKSYFSIAKIKSSVAIVKFYKNKEKIQNKNSIKIIINNKSFNNYFINFPNKKIFLLYPFLILKLKNKLNIIVKVKGGGLMSQLKAIQLAISKLLIYYNINFKKILNKYNLLKSDLRIKERKKYGLKKARKASQYSKR